MIRKACTLDALALVAMGTAYQQEAHGHDIFLLDLDRAVKQTLHAISDPDGCVLVAVRGTEVVGFFYAVRSTFIWSSVPLAVDQLLYVVPEHRGGMYGASLIKRYEQWAREQGIPVVQMSVASGITEERTSKLYKALGYAPVGSMYRKEIQSGFTKTASTTNPSQAA